LTKTFDSIIGSEGVPVTEEISKQQTPLKRLSMSLKEDRVPGEYVSP
jgi:hypothetical protein